MPATAENLIQISKTPKRKGTRELVNSHFAHEHIFAVVGHIGSGTSEICRQLQADLEEQDYQVNLIPASGIITSWAAETSAEIRVDLKKHERVRRLQDLGDEMRELDHTEIARRMILEIRNKRAASQGLASSEALVEPSGKKTAYILDSLRHPAEVHLLRSIYGKAFTLIGVVCDADVRMDRLYAKFTFPGKMESHPSERALIVGLMERDAKAEIKHGQRVSDAFFLSDAFLDNTQNRGPQQDWHLPDQIHRIVKIVTHEEVVRPTVEEYAMYVASGAQMQSACLSRQVGASLIDRAGNLLATGANEVPRAGGGVYSDGIGKIDERCAFRENSSLRKCSNNEGQNEVINALLAVLAPRLGHLTEEEKAALLSQLRKTPAGALLEFSRAVHAEMDAILSAARTGSSPVGGRMFVTTFPCHYCARHLVAAGVDEVHYIEPYPKSKAITLHEDSITTNPKGWTPPSVGGPKVLFRPFTGVAPRMYKYAFIKDRDYKDDTTGKMHISQPEWGGSWDVQRISYLQLEVELAKLPATE